MAALVIEDATDPCPHQEIETTNEDFLQLRELWPRDPNEGKTKIDLVAVHGLAGGSLSTWTHPNGSNWLSQFLPLYFDNIRIFSFGYRVRDAYIRGETYRMTGRVTTFAEELCNDLVDARKDKKRPIIFIGHGVGGIVVKAALAYAKARGLFGELITSTSHLFFLDTPHKGFDHNDWQAMSGDILTEAGQEQFGVWSTALADLGRAFTDIGPHLSITSYLASLPVAGGQYVVSESSAILGYENEAPLTLDRVSHLTMCKFQDHLDGSFQRIKNRMNTYVDQIMSSQAPPASQKKTFKLHDAARNTQDHSRSDDFETLSAESRSNEKQREESIKPNDSQWLPQTIHVPMSRNVQFTGRKDELQMLDRLFAETAGNGDTAERAVSIVAVYGLGGVGKTQLVNQYVHQIYATSKVSVFWFTADSISQLDSQYKKRAELLRNETSAEVNPLLQKLAKDYKQPGQETQLVLEWISLHKDYILVLDNFDDSTMNIRPFLPHKKQARILFTSRDRNVVGRYAHSGLHLKRPSPLDSGRLFLRLQGIHESTADTPKVHPEYQDIVQIVDELDGFPLAISQAAAFIRQNSPMRFAEYLELLRSGSNDREQLLRFSVGNPDYPASVMTTWEISLHYLEKTNTDAKDLLNILGFFSPFYILESMLRASVKSAPWHFGTSRGLRNLSPDQHQQLVFMKESVRFIRAVGSLVSLSLITRDPDIASLSVHPLVHEWIKIRLNSNPHEQSRLAFLSGLILYQTYPIDLSIPYSSQTQREKDHLQRNLHQSDQHMKEFIFNMCLYKSPEVSMPPECATLIVAELCMKVRMGGRRRFKDNIYTFLSDYGSKTFPVGEGLQGLQAALCSTLQKIRLYRSPVAWLEVARSVPKALRETYFANACKHSEMIFIMVYVSAVLALLETDPRWWKTRDPMKQNILEKNMTDAKAAALLELLGCLAVVPGRQPEISVLEVYVAYNLGGIISVDYYCTKAKPFLTKLHELSSFKYVPFRIATAYLELIAFFQWKCNPQDLEGILNTILLTTQLCIAESERQEDQRWHDMSSHQSYISSSFGRYSEAGRSGQDSVERLVQGLDKIWDLTIPAVDKVLEIRVESPALYDTPKLSRIYKALHQLHKAMHAMQEGAGDSRPFKSFKSVDLQGRIARLYTIEHSWLFASKAFYSYFNADYFLKFISTIDPGTWLRQRADILLPDAILPQFSLLRTAQENNRNSLAATPTDDLQEGGQAHVDPSLSAPPITMRSSLEGGSMRTGREEEMVSCLWSTNWSESNAKPPQKSTYQHDSTREGGGKHFSENLNEKIPDGHTLKSATCSFEESDMEASSEMMDLKSATTLLAQLPLSLPRYYERYYKISKAVEAVEDKMREEEKGWAVERRQLEERRAERTEARFIELGWTRNYQTAAEIPTAKQRQKLIEETKRNWELVKSEVKALAEAADQKPPPGLQAVSLVTRPGGHKGIREKDGETSAVKSRADQKTPTEYEIRMLTKNIEKTGQLVETNARELEDMVQRQRDEFDELYLAFSSYTRDAAQMLSSWVLCIEKLSAGEDESVEILCQPGEITRLQKSVSLIRDTPIESKVFRTLECLALVYLLAAATNSVRSTLKPEPESNESNDLDMLGFIPDVEDEFSEDDEESGQFEIERIHERSSREGLRALYRHMEQLSGYQAGEHLRQAP